MNIIIDYNAGNITSLANALEALNIAYKISSDPKEISIADKVLFPGQGNIAQAMRNLESKNLVECIKSLTQPFLGICVGMQLLYEYSEEGDTNGLGIIPGEVKRFSNENNIKVPQMGWNVIRQDKKDKVFDNIDEGDYFYFVNSYFCPTNEFTIAQADYGTAFTAVCKSENYYGVQFHPEKSGETGLRLLNNFLSIET